MSRAPALYFGVDVNYLWHVHCDMHVVGVLLGATTCCRGNPRLHQGHLQEVCLDISCAIVHRLHGPSVTDTCGVVLCSVLFCYTCYAVHQLRGHMAQALQISGCGSSARLWTAASAAKHTKICLSQADLNKHISNSNVLTGRGHERGGQAHPVHQVLTHHVLPPACPMSRNNAEMSTQKHPPHTPGNF